MTISYWRGIGALIGIGLNTAMALYAIFILRKTKLDHASQYTAVFKKTWKKLNWIPILTALLAAAYIKTALIIFFGVCLTFGFTMGFMAMLDLVMTLKFRSVVFADCRTFNSRSRDVARYELLYAFINCAISFPLCILLACLLGI